MLLAGLIIPVHADAAQVPEVLGASIRTVGNQGLRFVGRIKKTGSITLTYGENANFGFLLIPESSIPSGTSITKDTQYVSQVPAKTLMSKESIEAIGLTYDSDYYYFAVVQLNMPAHFYETNMVAKAYVNNGGTYTYSNSGAAEKRSIAYVAQAIKDMGGSVPAFITTVLAQAEAFGTDIRFSGDKFSVLTKYPDYPSAVATDGLYSVTVSQGAKNQALKVYNQCADYSEYDLNSTSRSLASYDNNRRFCEFAFAFEAVTVKIQVNKKFTSYMVSPTAKGLASSYSNGVISVTVDKPMQFVVILDNDYNTALSVFADAPETDIPTKGASGVVYVEGNSVITAPDGLVSYVGTNNETMVVQTNRTKIYLAPGAILTKRIMVSRYDAEKQGYAVKIYGRGAILDPFSNYKTSNPLQTTTVNDWDGSTNNAYPVMKAVVNVYSYSCSMKDIKILDGRNFNVLFAQSGCSADNVKILSTEMSTDGFMVSQNGTVKNSFIYNGDNSLVIGGGNGGHLYENITIGTTCAAIYPQYEFNGSLKDIYVFRADDNLINVHEDNSGAMTMNIDGLYANDCMKTPQIFADDGGNGSATKTFNLKNVVTRKFTSGKKSFTEGGSTNTNAALSSDSTGYVINFTNLYVGGNLIGPGGSNGIKVGGSTIGNNSAYGSTINNMTISFAHDSSNEPKNTTAPTSTTANYTSGASYVAGPIRDWTRYTSYNCKGYYEGSKFKVTTSNSSSRWGYTINLTEQMKKDGAGTYSYSVTTSGTGASGLLIKSQNGTNSVTTTSGKSGSITVTADDLAKYTYYFLVKVSITGSGTITIDSWSFGK